MKDGIKKRNARVAISCRRATSAEAPMTSTIAFTQDQIRRSGRWSANAQSLRDFPVTSSEIRLLLAHLRGEISNILEPKRDIDDQFKKTK